VSAFLVIADDALQPASFEFTAENLQQAYGGRLAPSELVAAAGAA
jgi:hypothetical protein